MSKQKLGNRMAGVQTIFLPAPWEQAFLTKMCSDSHQLSTAEIKEAMGSKAAGGCPARGKRRPSPGGCLGIKTTIHFLLFQRLVYFSFVCMTMAAHPLPVAHFYPQNPSRLSSGRVRCLSEVIHKEERAGQEGLVPLPCSCAVLDGVW